MASSGSASGKGSDSISSRSPTRTRAQMWRNAVGAVNSQMVAAMMKRLLTKIANTKGPNTSKVAMTRPTGPKVTADDLQRE